MRDDVNETIIRGLQAQLTKASEEKAELLDRIRVLEGQVREMKSKLKTEQTESALGRKTQPLNSHPAYRIEGDPYHGG